MLQVFWILCHRFSGFLAYYIDFIWNLCRMFEKNFPKSVPYPPLWFLVNWRLITMVTKYRAFGTLFQEFFPFTFGRYILSWDNLRPIIIFSLLQMTLTFSPENLRNFFFSNFGHCEDSKQVFSKLFFVEWSQYNVDSADI